MDHQMRENLIHSFRKTKADIMGLQKEALELKQGQENIIKTLTALRENQAQVQKTNRDLYYKLTRMLSEKKQSVKTVTKKAAKVYVAPKDGKTFHLENCPFAQNIKPKNKQVFKSKTKALNKGLKACRCVK